MRICIMTLPLGMNYGGLLQAYALQTVLKSMGHEVWTEDRKDNKLSAYRRIRQFVKQMIAPFLGLVFPRFRKAYYQHLNYFIRRHITTTVSVYSTDKSPLNRYEFEAYVVGSDQVWRPAYSRGLSNYFLDFTKGRSVRRIAYAASFGTDRWEFTPQQTEECAALARMFDAISVREDSGVELCAKHLGVQALRLPDPTMLLEREDYIRLIESEDSGIADRSLLTYILDTSKDKQLIIGKISNTLSLKPFDILPEKQIRGIRSKWIGQYAYCPVSTWLSGFKNADYVITDSFHGTVFSILFERPFVVIANHSRGMSRFTSLLKVYGLESRLVLLSKELSSDLIRQPIDWQRVRKIRKAEKNNAMKFLHDHLI